MRERGPNCVEKEHWHFARVIRLLVFCVSLAICTYRPAIGLVVGELGSRVALTLHFFLRGGQRQKA